MENIIRDYEIDPEDLISFGREIIELSGVCDKCDGDGTEDDGEAIIGACPHCEGGFIKNG